ncbi:MAG: hypothetical protein H7122_16640 [Chitinophagaceae bacterium]|nr:hypothetical protein [Chitinophagaceae bacterium]
MEIIKKILESAFFSNRPPVLIDIGASGEINQKWKWIAPYSICIAFDADDREFHVTEQTNKEYKKLISFNRIVTSEPADKATFYLTASPYCSSLLVPQSEKLEPWIFSDLFKVERSTSLATITLAEALTKVNINYIDWFKTDTQGTDLRLYNTLPQGVSAQILAAEFEPGIMDAYAGEDKLFQVMQEMHKNDFWLSSMEVKGVQRLKSNYAKELGMGTIKRVIRKSPGWAEVTYLRLPIVIAQRQFLMLYIFALIERQYGFALEVADKALEKFPDNIFQDCRNTVLKKIKSDRWKIPFIIFKRQVKKILPGIDD